MKRVVSIISVLLAICQSAFAYDFSAVSPSGHTLYYSINGYAVAVSCNGEHIVGNLIIPANVTHNGVSYGVTRIDDFAFSGCVSMTSVTFPISISSIGEYAFQRCESLTSITLPPYVSTTGSGVFEDCSNLVSVVISDFITSISFKMFSGCGRLTSVTFSDEYSFLTSIGHEAFQYCHSLRSLTIPNSVTSIGASAFYDCSSLTSITIGSSVDTIYSEAFMFCNNLSEIICQSSTVPLLEWDVFFGVSSLIPVYIPCGSTAYYQSGWTYFSNFVESSFAYTLNVQVNDTTMGNAVIMSRPNCQNTAMIAAVTNPYYTFDFWSDGDTTNPRTITLTSNTSLEAHFSSSVRYEYLYINVYVHDTTYIDVHDTTYINVPYAVHDTTIITDTLTLTEYVPVHDTTVIIDTLTLTEYVPVHDTTYIDVHDTTYIDVPYAVYDTTIVTDTVTMTEYVTIHDTTYVPVNDTTIVTVPVHDTTIVTEYVHDTTTVTEYIHDTTTVYVEVHDTVWLTEYIHDTIYIHDTVVGVDEVDAINAKVFSNSGQIVVEGADGNMVALFDLNGRVLATKRDEYSSLRFDVPTSGTYMIKIGNHPARKVVVVR